MAVLPLGAKNSKKGTTNPSHVQCQKKKKKTSQRDDERPAPWGRALKSFFSCKHHQTVAVEVEKVKRPTTRTGWSGVLCSLRESSSKVMQRPEPTSPAADSLKNNGGSSSSSISDMSGALTTSSSSSLSHSSASITAATSSSSSSSLGNGSGGSFRGMHVRRFSGCFECHHAVVDPTTTGVLSRVPSSSSSRRSSAPFVGRSSPSARL